MKISKTTLNFALKRALDITVWHELDDGAISHALWHVDNDNEPLLIFSQNAKNEFFMLTNVTLDNLMWVELEQFIKNEKELRMAIDQISKY